MSTSAPQPTPGQQPAPLAPRPFGILMLAGYQLLVGGFGLFMALFIGGPTLYATVLNGGMRESLLLWPVAIVGAFFGFVVAVAIGLLRRRPWAHRVTIGVIVLELLLAATAAIASQGQTVGLLGIAINVYIVYYLVSPKVYAYFGKA